MIRNANYYLHGDLDWRDAYIQGYLKAMQVNKHPIPISGDADEIGLWVETTAVAYDLECETQYRARLRKIIAAGRYSKKDFRCLLLDTWAVNDEGNEFTSLGEAVTEDVDREPYPNEFISDGYMAGGAFVQNGRRVRYLNIQGRDGLTLFQLRSNDWMAMAAFLEADIMIGDPIDELYLKESADGGRLEDYREVIVEACAKIKPQHDAHSAPLLSTAPVMRANSMVSASRATGDVAVSQDERDLRLIHRIITSYVIHTEFKDSFNRTRWISMETILEEPKRDSPDWQNDVRSLLRWAVERVQNFENTNIILSEYHHAVCGIARRLLKEDEAASQRPSQDGGASAAATTYKALADEA